MFGPSVRFPNSSRVTPFGHALFGGRRTTLSASGLSGSETDFTWAAGGGFDVGVTKHVGVRLAQADFLQTRIAGQSQNHFRYSAGLVLKF
jgi:peptidoglycan-associated lipoprotein